MSEWQPPDSAPRDGSMILGVVRGRTVLASFDDCPTATYPWDIVHIDRGWISEDAVSESTLTAWMPIPTPRPSPEA